MTSSPSSGPPEGRELDTMIAERVMGYQYDHVSGEKWAEDRLYGHEGRGGLWIVRPSDGPVDYRAGLPHYSTDIAAAWLVVEKMREHPNVALSNLRLVAWCYSRTYATFGAEEGEWSEGNGEHATPLAICLAALAASVPTGEEPK